jgi:Histone methylation protein DOT1
MQVRSKSDMKRTVRDVDSTTTTPKRRPRGLEIVHDSAIIGPVEHVNEGRVEDHDVQLQQQAAVTPATTTSTLSSRSSIDTKKRNINVRRKLFPDPLLSTTASAVAVTPSRTSQVASKALENRTITPSPAKRKIIFGRSVIEIEVKDSVKQVYSIIRKLTGSIGGNSSFGPIYGELTMGSMQKMINLMKEHTNLDSTSYFIDVGSGIGKPNLHVAQDPCVALSYGIEVESDRWLLGMNCLKGVLDAVSEQQKQQMNETILNDNERLHHNCIYVHGDITDAHTFDPFTHVYMFSVGFPPKLWCELANMWNRSTSPYLICYHGPNHIIHEYDFHVKLLVQTPTSMHGSKEGHMGYIYQRMETARTERHSIGIHAAMTPTTKRLIGIHEQQTTLEQCDPYYVPAIEIVVDGGYHQLQKYVMSKVKDQMEPEMRRTRSQRR